jgi:hypothetical protein
MWERSAEDGHRSHLQVEHMAALFKDYLLPRLCMKAYADLVAHCPGGYKKGGFFSDHLRSQFLKPVDRRVLAADVIAHLGPQHGLSHLAGRLCHRIASQIDVVHLITHVPDRSLNQESAIIAWQAPAMSQRGEGLLRVWGCASRLGGGD